ncbi:ABC transporter substrate-binding protein/permease [Iodidimonas sp. SYSU 1G8]|uniref:ABC transporter substrate-binding protein/permease n=1 Tax=Iodidimonas sp. SYSU 1G8 TaxID=3133967 RepID=UPI0031FF0D03
MGHIARRIAAVCVLLVCTLVLAGCGDDRRVINTPEDVGDASIGVMTGSTGETIARQRFPDAELKSFDDIMDAVAAVKSGQLDAIVTAYSTALQVTKKNAEFKIIGGRLQPEYSSVALRKNDPLLPVLNALIADLRADGTLASMEKRWFKEDLSPYEEPEIAVPAQGDPLRIGVAATREPVNFVDETGRITGYDGELARRIAVRLGRPIVFSNMKFMALIPALQSGKIDLIVTGMSATDERRKYVDFSDSYYLNGQVVLTSSGTGPAHGGSFIQRVADSFHGNIIHEKRYLLIWDGLKVTVMLSILATVFGTALGALVCFMRMSRSALLSVPAKIYISVLRGMPVLVLLMLIYYVAFASVNISPLLVAVVAFGMNFGAYSSEIFRTGIEGVDKGQSEAGIAMGFTKVQTFNHIVLPQTIRRILPVYKGEFISLVKMTSIVGYIAVQDLTKASDIIRSRTFDAFFPLVMVAILYFLISWGLMQFLGYLERATDPKYKRRKGARA